MMRVGIATDHGGFGLKRELFAQLRAAGHDVVKTEDKGQARGQTFLGGGVARPARGRELASWAKRSPTGRQCVKSYLAKSLKNATSPRRRSRGFRVESGPISAPARTTTQLDERRAKKCSANERSCDCSTGGDAARHCCHSLR
jgi:hypothetical protein